MSNFKRNSSSFQRGGSTGAAPARPAANTGAPSYPSRNQRDAGASNGAGRSKAFPFTQLGNLTVAKSVDDGTYESIMNDLRGNESIKLTSKVYLPKGVTEITLRTGDMLLVDFKIGERDKDFVVGRISKKND